MPDRSDITFFSDDSWRHRRHHDSEDETWDRGRHHGHGGHHGHRGHHGHGRHGLHSGRKLSASDLQLILLALLEIAPAHGYELIKALEERSHGLYVPSPGMIYPALTYLEEIGYAAVETEGNRKRYSLTDTGRSHYRQSHEIAARILTDMERIGAQMAQARQAIADGLIPEETPSGGIDAELEAARQAIRRAQRKEGPYTPDEAQGIASILTHAAEEIRRLLQAAEGENKQ